MSGGNICKCPESKKPIRERAWRVFARKVNFSAFSGYRYTYSEYSAVHCRACFSHWRTKAAYVSKLEDGALT